VIPKIFEIWLHVLNMLIFGNSDIVSGKKSFEAILTHRPRGFERRERMTRMFRGVCGR
jgi:hypothetical protein